jgi:hypothetical protein
VTAERLGRLLADVRSGAIDVEQALAQLRNLPYADLGYARVDHHRALRQGMPEVILAEGKTAEQVAGVARELIATGQSVLVTRLGAEQAGVVLSAVPELAYSAIARTAAWSSAPAPRLCDRPVPVVTAGTSDIPVAEEAAESLRALGAEPRRLFDVGVAGIHRLLGDLESLRAAPALIVVAGMEGALPSVVGGLVPAPIVAVPTSVGYGVSFGGLTALFGMLAGCASGVTVVNIDNGFGAAAAVARILRARGAEAGR